MFLTSGSVHKYEPEPKGMREHLVTAAGRFLV